MGYLFGASARRLMVSRSVTVGLYIAPGATGEAVSGAGKPAAGTAGGGRAVLHRAASRLPPLATTGHAAVMRSAAKVRAQRRRPPLRIQQARAAVVHPTAPIAPVRFRPAASPAGNAPGATAAAGGAATHGSGGPAGGGAGVGGGGGGALAVVDHPPLLIFRVMPQYPPDARQSGFEGEVVLRAVVDQRGYVEPRIQVVRSQPPFDKYAIAALRQWRFEPGRDSADRPVRVLIEVPMAFKLR
jgi:TonB family protein